jgi:putative two-component system response regulator
MNLNELKNYTSTLSILYVEDFYDTRLQIEAILKTFFLYVEVAKDGIDALSKYTKDRFDIVLTDLSMPNLNGIEMIKFIKEIDYNQNIIIMSAHNEFEYLYEAIQFNVDGFIAKPFEQYHFFNSIYKVSKKIKESKELIYYKLHLEHLVAQKTNELNILNNEIHETLEETILSLGAAAEARSHETSNHVKRVSEYSAILGTLANLNRDDVSLLKKISPMHDLGKLAIPDDILNKPDKLTQNEYQIMKTHSVMGYEILKNSDRELFKMASIISLSHHEYYNGNGYPNAQKGENIHLFARITSICDVFDALGMPRIYKKAWDIKDIIEYFKIQRGEQFDPYLTDLFLDNLDEFIHIKDKYQD